MTTSFSSAPVAVPEELPLQAQIRKPAPPPVRRRHTLASRLAFVTICAVIVVATLAYGTLHNWALALFTLSALVLVLLWAVDAFVRRSVLGPVKPLRWPVVGMVLRGLIQPLPRRACDRAGPPLSPARSLSLDAWSARPGGVQVTVLLVYFAATAVFVYSPRRLRALVQ